MNQTAFRKYFKLKEKKVITRNAIPKSVLHSAQFTGLVSSGILKREKSGRGFRIIVDQPEEFDRFFDTHFPEPGEVGNKVDNVRMFRNSKVRPMLSLPVFLLRGFRPVVVDGHSVDLAYFTSRFQMFACAGSEITTEKIYLVENLDTFFIAEKLLGDDFVYAHKYGRIGQESLRVFEPEELLVFVDYDFNGLDEYLRVLEVFDFAQLYIPPDFEELFARYSKSLSGNKASMSVRLHNSVMKEVVNIREMVLRTNRFLEQQYWKYD